MEQNIIDIRAVPSNLHLNINGTKSTFDLSLKKFGHLGFLIYSIPMTVSLTEHKIMKLEKFCKDNILTILNHHLHLVDGVIVKPLLHINVKGTSCYLQMSKSIMWEDKKRKYCKWYNYDHFLLGYTIRYLLHGCSFNRERKLKTKTERILDRNIFNNIYWMLLTSEIDFLFLHKTTKICFIEIIIIFFSNMASFQDNNFTTSNLQIGWNTFNSSTMRTCLLK